VQGGANPPLTYTISGFVNGDTQAVVGGGATLSTTASASSPAGAYPVTFASVSLTAVNYDFPNLVPGTLTVSPRVLDVRVRWGSQSMSLVNLTRDLPFLNINAIDILFSDDVVADQTSLALKSTVPNGPTYSFSGYSYNPGSHDATWTLPSPIGVDRLMILLNGTPMSANGGTGVHANPNIYLGSDYPLGFAVLPGDSDGDGVVTIADAVGILGQSAPNATYSPFADIDGNGVNDLSDYVAVRRRINTRLS